MPTLKIVDPSFARSAQHTVVVEQTIGSDPARIWAVLSDNATWTTWFPGMTQCITTSAEPTGIGSTRTVKVGPLVADEQFILWETNVIWGFCVTRTNLPVASKMLEQVELVSNRSGGTLVRYTGAFEPHTFSRLTFGLTKRQVRAVWTAGLAGLEQAVLAKQ
jgi:hypothetical protein